ncbi:hypothetical protein NE686_17585 [Tissierella carlieri]|uniref:Uncharacterized protein n=1 Tax=Tissierella carlieri TaxID=689904 RepID=A0ABT1SEK4_9FIRM|nr:hypothetical protein [Tissierella carlieri]MCQ4924918.1 hypothetical protein [Tissierella carlieri]
MKLNRTLLSIILALQDCKQFELSKYLLDKCKDENVSCKWHENVEKYFFSIDDSLMSNAGIGKNAHTFERILSCKVPDEVYDIEYCDLRKFEVYM